MIRIVLLDLLLDIFVAITLVVVYHIVDIIAIDILYGKGIAKFDSDYQFDRLVSILIIGLIPIINIMCLCYMLWTFEYRVEAFTWGIYRLARKKHGVIVRKTIKTRKKEIRNDI